VSSVPLFQSPYEGVAAERHLHAAQGRIGVLLCNLGTPDAPTAAAVRRYLGQFLADPRLIELPRWLWLPVLHGIILNLRPRRSAHAYSRIWTAEGSPLMAFSIAQHAALETRLQSLYPDRVQVALAMRYGNPSIADALATLRDADVRRVLVLPLYPQYSGPSSGSVFDAVSQTLQRWRWVPDVRFIASYHDDPGYLAAVAASITAHWQQAGRGERLYFSFHGLPHKYFLQGDPYFCHCHGSARLIAARLGLRDDEWQVVFQSRFGRTRWLEPYADRTWAAAARAGVKRVDVVCPGFAVDCLETLEEIALQNREAFIAAGGTDLCYIPALNATARHIDALSDLIVRNLAGWPECEAAWNEAQAHAEREARLERARSLGATS